MKEALVRHPYAPKSLRESLTHTLLRAYLLTRVLHTYAAISAVEQEQDSDTETSSEDSAAEELWTRSNARLENGEDDDGDDGGDCGGE